MVMNAVLAVARESRAQLAASMLTGMQGIGAASVVLQTYASTVLAQADVQLTILPDLPARQAKARDSAKTWLGTTNPKAIAALADVRDFANHVAAYVDAMYPAAQKYDAGDKAQLPTIIDGLQHLLVLAQAKAASAPALISDVQLYQNAVAADCTAFADAAAKVQAQITGDQGEIAQLRQQLADLNQRMNADIVQISAGAVSDIVGIGMIVVAATTVIETGGATQTLLAAGITLVAGGTLAMTISAADIVGAQKEYGETMNALVDLELEVAAFDTVAHQITANGVQAKAASEAAAMLAAGWSGAVDAYVKTISDLQHNPEGYLALRLAAMKREWFGLGQQAVALMQQGSLEFKTEPSLKVAS